MRQDQPGPDRASPDRATPETRCTRRPKTKERRRSSHVIVKYINQDSGTFHLAHGQDSWAELSGAVCAGVEPSWALLSSCDSCCSELQRNGQCAAAASIEVVINEIGIVEDGVWRSVELPQQTTIMECTDFEGYRNAWRSCESLNSMRSAENGAQIRDLRFWEAQRRAHEAKNSETCTVSYILRPEFKFLVNNLINFKYILV